MSVPYGIFLGIYLAAVLFVLLYTFFNLFHLLRFSRLSTMAVAMTFILIAGTLFILFISYRSFSKVDWHDSFEVNTVGADLKEFNPL
ncbi:MAG: hypothetical protein Q8P77_03605 [Candidatus Veblenbacteria bacterium]|nr:hypothetical protein [Candidatus Veblenbacteria bacterium]